MYEDFTEFGRQHVSGLFAATITNVGHQILSFEPSSHSVVNTLGFTPIGLYTQTVYKHWINDAQSTYFGQLETYLEFVITITLMSDKLLGTFFDNMWTILRFDRHCNSVNRNSK